MKTRYIISQDNTLAINTNQITAIDLQHYQNEDICIYGDEDNKEEPFFMYIETTGGQRYCMGEYRSKIAYQRALDTLCHQICSSIYEKNVINIPD